LPQIYKKISPKCRTINPQTRNIKIVFTAFQMQLMHQKSPTQYAQLHLPNFQGVKPKDPLDGGGAWRPSPLPTTSSAFDITRGRFAPRPQASHQVNLALLSGIVAGPYLGGSSFFWDIFEPPEKSF
jgi:hypothetical protein